MDKAKPNKTEFLIQSNKLEKMRPRFVKVATHIRKFKKRASCYRDKPHCKTSVAQRATKHCNLSDTNSGRPRRLLVGRGHLGVDHLLGNGGPNYVAGVGREG